MIALECSRTSLNLHWCHLYFFQWSFLCKHVWERIWLTLRFSFIGHMMIKARILIITSKSLSWIFPACKYRQLWRCKPLSCCPHLFFNVCEKGGPALWDGNLMHINTRPHLWDSEGKTLRPSYRGWKKYTWIKERGCQCTHSQTHAHTHTHIIPHMSSWRRSQWELPLGMFLGPHLWSL